MYKTGGLRSFFWDRDPNILMSFPDFLNSHNATSGSVIFAIEHVPVRGDPVFCGMFTLSNFVGKHRATLGMWIEPKYRGVNTHWIGKQVLTYCHKSVGLANVFALTPWRHAAECAGRMGMIQVADLPDYCKFGERIMDVMVFHSDAQLWRHQVKADIESMGYLPNTAEQLMRDYVGDEKMIMEAGYDG